MVSVYLILGSVHGPDQLALFYMTVPRNTDLTVQARQQSATVHPLFHERAPPILGCVLHYTLIRYGLLS